MSNIILIRCTDEVKQALRNRSQIEGSTTSAIARKAIQQFLTTPVEKLSIAG